MGIPYRGRRMTFENTRVKKKHIVPKGEGSMDVIGREKGSGWGEFTGGYLGKAK